jgi:hypothetical protein
VHNPAQVAREVLLQLMQHGVRLVTSCFGDISEEAVLQALERGRERLGSGSNNAPRPACLCINTSTLTDANQHSKQQFVQMQRI